MKRIAFAALVACALSAANAALAAIVVYPTGDYPTDVQNVQAAVDQGGTVLLKAQNAAGVATAFNFGPPVQGLGFVTLHRDVELLGEQLGATMTTVDGGWYPVRGGIRSDQGHHTRHCLRGPVGGRAFLF
jgi:opacity protein-like surface antigen